MKSAPEAKDFSISSSNKLRLRPDVPPSESYSDESRLGSQLRMAETQHPSFYEYPEGQFLGSHFRPGAPFRAKITPPHEPGKTLVIKGRVWAYDTKEPLARAKMDIWQANAEGHYDTPVVSTPEFDDAFTNRARLYCDQNGYYEFETIHPGPYRISDHEWRAPHINFRVRSPGYDTLVTQLFFQSDPYHELDPFVQPSLVVGLQEKESHGVIYEEGFFDIVLRATGI